MEVFNLQVGLEGSTEKETWHKKAGWENSGSKQAEKGDG